MLPFIFPVVTGLPLREKMSTVDTAWLRMDSDSNLMMIVAVLMFDRPINADRFRQMLVQRFLPYKRFRSRVIQSFGTSWWEQQDVDLNQHVIVRRLKSALPNNKAALEQMVSQLAATPLDPDLPLWQMHMVNNCIGVDGKQRQAIIIRIHHCIADGIALVGVLLSMFDASYDAEPQSPPMVKQRAEQAEENPWLQIMQPVTKTAISAINLSGLVWTKYLWMLADPAKFAERVSGAGKVTTRFAQDAARLALMPVDTHTRLKGKPQGVKHIAWSEPLPLAEVKVIGRALGASINDVLMASVAGAIGGYLRDKGDAVASNSLLRAMVPVNLRRSGRQQKLGNAFGLVPLLLPVGLEDPIARLNDVRHRMGELKDGYQALVAMVLLGVLGATPKQMQVEVQNYFARRATMVMSNVPGPQAPLFLAGSQLDQIMFWVPQSGDVGVGVSILSYNGGVQFGIVTDAALVDDPQLIINRFAPEFEKFVMLALMAE
ncbi:MAG: wax ester/triacylglycerol synthase family O-acyltransferase [Herbaspirillum sp.]